MYGKEIRKLYGPYLRKDGRKHVILVFVDGSKKTISYPKYIMEQHLGRVLDPDTETVDHIDRDISNNDLSNLRVIDRASHAREDAIHRDIIKGNCIWCSLEITLTKNQINNRATSKAGPFCGSICVGKYGSYIQQGGSVLGREDFNLSYHMKCK